MRPSQHPGRMQLFGRGAVLGLAVLTAACSSSGADQVITATTAAAVTVSTTTSEPAIPSTVAEPLVPESAEPASIDVSKVTFTVNGQPAAGAVDVPDDGLISLMLAGFPEGKSLVIAVCQGTRAPGQLLDIPCALPRSGEGEPTGPFLVADAAAGLTVVAVREVELFLTDPVDGPQGSEWVDCALIHCSLHFATLDGPFSGTSLASVGLVFLE